MTEPAAAALPLWTVLPFVAYLAALALVPLALPRFWESNRNKLAMAAAFGLPVAAGLCLAGLASWLVHSAREYAAFITFLASLFVIAGGVHLRGSLGGTPLANTALLAVGAVLASLVGTTGASMLLLPPLLRANEKRVGKTHIVVFFIFIVSNGGGLLTPLGDPPLYIGFLRGVPFLWTLRLLGPWALVNGALLALFNVLDQRILAREERERPGPQLEEVQRLPEPLRVEGRRNLLYLVGVPAAVYLTARYGHTLHADPRVPLMVQIAAMAALAAASLLTTPPAVRRANQFTWAPILEVAAIFAGVFVTMVPALKVLEARGAALGLTRPWHFFWSAGLLSSFLDNAPTYLTFVSLAVAVLNQAGARFTADDLGPVVQHPLGALYIAAVSCGAVFMGANTYIGNGPNFMVKAMAEHRGVPMPGFFGYMLWSLAVLVPLFVVVTVVFFV
ncbi:MAG TPA: sodium:proton antiporter [Chloroflexota bacterium]|nr:sodium:proton antiporter [Chloroflexota bacterium]